MDINYLSQLGVAGILIVLILQLFLQQLLPFLRSLIPIKGANGLNGSGTTKAAGSQSVEFWQHSHRETLKMFMNPELVAMKDDLKDINAAMRDINTTNQDIRVAMMELVTLTKLNKPL